MKKVFFWVMIFLIGGLGGLVMDKYVFPYLSSTALFSKAKFLKETSDNVTVINKTEQVFVKEENTVNKVTNKISASLVKIIAYEENNSNILETKNSLGTIMTSDGLILTSKEIVSNEKTKYKVELSDGSTFDGTLFGEDAFSDLAFIKIEAANLSVASLTNSDDIKTGEKIIAFGGSQGEEVFSVSSGLIKSFDEKFSLSNKIVSSSEKAEGCYKLDTRLDDSFVGGIITDFASQIVGVVGKTNVDDVEQYYAIPSNTLKMIVEKAIKKELAESPELGIYYVSLDKNLSSIKNINREQGAMIYTPSQNQSLAILFGSPAQKAGLKLNDIITKINDEEITPDKPLSNLLYQYKKGDTITLTIIRKEEEITKEITL